MRAMSKPLLAGRWLIGPASRSSLALLAVALLCLCFADLEIVTRTPWTELGRMTQGLLHPQWLPWTELVGAFTQTLSYALLAVAVSAPVGLALSLCYHLKTLRVICASIRSVHELFWGLLFIQVVGIHPLAGILAITLPYTGIFAKVFSEMIAEYQHQPSALADKVIPANTTKISRFFYAHWPPLLAQFRNYTLYRFECAIRSSTVLGFIGLPTLGFHLETAFMQGLYAQAAGILLLFYALIAGISYWAKPVVMPIYIIAAAIFLWQQQPVEWSLLSHLAVDVVPAPFRNGTEFYPWISQIVSTMLLPGITNTLVITQLSLVVAGILALLMFPLISKQFNPRPVRVTGQLGLVVLRSTPEIIIAFACLLLWGPSMLPAVVALGIHNGAIVAHLIGRHSDQHALRLDASGGLNRYHFEILPRVYGQFLAFLCYRWEVILRESAILGILGIHTLGFFIDSAFESFRLDIALILIITTALLNITIDHLSRWIRQRLHLQSTPLASTAC
jgi:phosphonate transport system permease protein